MWSWEVCVHRRQPMIHKLYFVFSVMFMDQCWCWNVEKSKRSDLILCGEKNFFNLFFVFFIKEEFWCFLLLESFWAGRDWRKVSYQNHETPVRPVLIFPFSWFLGSETSSPGCLPEPLIISCSFTAGITLLYGQMEIFQIWHQQVSSSVGNRAATSVFFLHPPSVIFHDALVSYLWTPLAKK